MGREGCVGIWEWQGGVTRAGGPIGAVGWCQGLVPGSRAGDLGLRVTGGRGEAGRGRKGTVGAP